MINNFCKNKTYIANSIDYNIIFKNRIGGNIPIYFENRLDFLTDYLFYAIIEHPQINNKVISIFIPKEYSFMLKENIYPNCSIKVFIHDYSAESGIDIYTNRNLTRKSIDNFIEIEEKNYQGNLIKIGGSPILIQNEDYYSTKLISDGYSFFMQIDEDFYTDDMLTGNYPFGYGCLYLYCKYNKEQINEIISGFWQYS